METPVTFGETASPERVKIVEQAAEWFVRLNDGQPPPDLWREFEAWLGADSRHAAAYDDIGRLWKGIGTVPEIKRHSGLERARVTRRQLGAIAAIALVGGAAWALTSQPSADFETSKAERRRVALPDGSMLELSADTRVALAFSAEQRRLVLMQGEIFVEVMAGSAPFVVDASTTQITALGTAFGVTRNSRDVRVVVTEHAVRMVAGADERRIGQGEAASFDGDRLGSVEPQQDGIDLAWRDGRLVFADASLDTVIDTINRWRASQLVLMPGTARPAVTLIGDVGKVDDMIDELARVLSVRLVDVGPWMTLMIPA